MLVTINALRIIYTPKFTFKIFSYLSRTIIVSQGSNALLQNHVCLPAEPTNTGIDVYCLHRPLYLWAYLQD